MVSKWSVAAAVPILFAFGSGAHAQTCVGQPSLSETHFNVGASVRNVSQGRGIEGRSGFGNARVFGSATLGAIGYEYGTRMRSYIAGVAGGVAKNLGGSGSICPMVAVEYENGPENIMYGQTELSGFVGLSVGGVQRLSEGVGLVSFVSAGYQSVRTSTKDFNQPESRKYTDGGPGGAVGIGLVFDQRVLVRTSLHLPPINNDGEVRQAYFVLGFSFSPAGRR